MENVEKRMELIRMMRSEHEQNIGRIQRRESILHEKSTIDSVSHISNWGFYVRFGISVGLFLLFFYMDRNNSSYLGITCDMVQNMISDTFDLKSFAFMQ